MTIGRKSWVIAEGYMPGWSHADRPELESHETACILNPGDEDAEVEVTIYFSDRDPAGPYRIQVPARRTHHMRFNDLRDPEPIPKETDFSSVFISTQPVVIQHTRLDSRAKANALLSTMAFPGAE